MSVGNVAVGGTKGASEEWLKRGRAVTELFLHQARQDERRDILN